MLLRRAALAPEIVDEHREADVRVLQLPEPQRGQRVDLHPSGRETTACCNASMGKLALQGEWAKSEEALRGVPVQADHDDPQVEP